MTVSFLYGVTDTELRKRYNAGMERLKSKYNTAKEEKSVSFITTLPFLGCGVSSDGVKADPKHTDKLRQLQSPKNVKEAFSGLINNFDRMIPSYAAKTR